MVKALTADTLQENLGDDPFSIGTTDAVNDDPLTPEEQAIYDAQMNEDADPNAAAVAAEESSVADDAAVVQDELNVEDPPPAEDPPATDPEDPPADPEDPPADPEAAAAEAAAAEAAAAEAGGILPAPEGDEEQPAPITIPKSRFDQVLGQNRNLRERLQVLETAAQTQAAVAEVEQTPFELELDTESVTRALDAAVDGKPEDGATAIVDMIKGAVEKAVSHTQSIMRTEFEAQGANLVQTAVAEVSAGQDATVYESTLTDLETQYPMLNPDNETEYNEQFASDAFDMYEGLLRKGHSRSAALTKAVKGQVALDYPDRLVPPAAERTSPAADPNAQPAAVAQQSKPAIERNAAAASAQPPRASGTPNAQENQGAIDFEKLTDDEFDALPESVRSQHRGDFL